MLELSQTMLRRVKRRDKAARWVVTFGGAAIILSVLAILVLIVGVTLPLFQPAGSRDRPLAAAGGHCPQGRGCPGRRGGSGRQQAAGRPSAHPRRRRDLRRPPRRERLAAESAGAGGRRVAQSRSKSAPRQIRAAETIGPGTYTLVWSDGAISLVEIVSETPGGKGKQAEVVRSVRVAADIPPEKGQMPLRAVVRASKEKEGTWTCAAVLPGDRILLIHTSREETLGGETSEKTVRTMLSCPVSAGLGPIALDRGNDPVRGDVRRRVALVETRRRRQRRQAGSHARLPRQAGDHLAGAALGRRFPGGRRRPGTAHHLVLRPHRRVVGVGAEAAVDSHPGVPCGGGAGNHSLLAEQDAVELRRRWRCRHGPHDQRTPFGDDPRSNRPWRWRRCRFARTPRREWTPTAA